MYDTGCWQWARVVLVLAALFGVVAMHSTIGPTHEPAMQAQATVESLHEQLAAPSTTSSALVSPVLVDHIGPAAASSPDTPGHRPMPMPHALIHLCLAVLAVGIVLGLLAVAIAILLRHEIAPAPTAVPPATRPSRPPRRSALRLAQLCVLRN